MTIPEMLMVAALALGVVFAGACGWLAWLSRPRREQHGRENRHLAWLRAEKARRGWED